MSGWPGHYYNYGVLVAACHRFIDADSQRIIQRFNYSEQFHTPPFPGSYDDQPAWWIDAAGIILSERAAALESHRKREVTHAGHA